jgi:hypothetical protein
MHSMPLYRAFYFAQRNEWFSDERHDNASARQFSKENFNRVFGVLDRKVFGVLDRVQEDWLQAIFIRLLFAFNAPADRLMKAEWRHITEDRWYPWLKGERELWWCYARRINDETKLLLQTLHDRARNEFGDSHFLFPSKLSSTGHITTFQKTWRSVARECNLDRRDLTSLIRAYHRLNGPWFNGNPQKYGKIVQNIALRPE